MSERIETAQDAIAKHGTAVDAVLAVGYEVMGWSPSQFGMLIAAMAQEVAAAEKARQEKTP